jgi:hypothetical protein
MKRFTETTKWNDPWFRKLEPRLKCLWLFLCDFCDSAGVIKPDFEHASFLIGQPVSADDLPLFNGRLEKLENDYFWIIKFCSFQYKVLHRSCAPQRAVLDTLSKFGLEERVNGQKRKHLNTNHRAKG